MTPARSRTASSPPAEDEAEAEAEATSQTQAAEGGTHDPGVPSGASCDGGLPAASAPAGTAAEDSDGMISTRSVGQVGSPVATSTTVPGATGEGAPRAGILGTGVETRAQAGGGGSSSSAEALFMFRDAATEPRVQTWAQSGNSEAREAPLGGAQRVAPGASPVAVMRGAAAAAAAGEEEGAEPSSSASGVPSAECARGVLAFSSAAWKSASAACASALSSGSELRCVSIAWAMAAWAREPKTRRRWSSSSCGTTECFFFFFFF